MTCVKGNIRKTYRNTYIFWVIKESIIKVTPLDEKGVYESGRIWGQREVKQTNKQNINK